MIVDSKKKTNTNTHVLVQQKTTVFELDKNNPVYILLFLPFKRSRNRSLPNKGATIRRQNGHFPFWNINVRPKRRKVSFGNTKITIPQSLTQ
jgi:hypothetical protein